MNGRALARRPVGWVRRLVRWPLQHPVGAIWLFAAARIIAERGL